MFRWPGFEPWEGSLCYLQSVSLPKPVTANLFGFWEGEKPENPERNPWSKDENQQQTQPTHDTGPEMNPTTLVGDERSHHCAIPAPLYG